MAVLPDPVQKLINALERLPGIGPKTASRLAFYFLRASDNISLDLADALTHLKTDTSFCRVCFNITLSGQEICDICQSDKRDPTVICVVEEPLDVLVFERINAFQGRYHVLGGVISPVEGVGPEDLKIQPLLARIKTDQVREIVVATNPSMEGDATAQYLYKLIAPQGVRVTRLARGLPVGSDLEYADQTTLLRALAGRQEIN